MFNLLAMTVADDMNSSISTLVSIFTSIFSSAWQLIEGNWFLLACIGVPFIGGILFAVISFFRKS